MNHFADQQLVPCVRSKILDDFVNLNEIKDEYFTIKVVKDINVSCVNCKIPDCENCDELKSLYEDFGLPIKIKAKKKDFVNWRKKQLGIDPDSLFYYYKAFDANIFGKLIISKGYYCIEAIDETNSLLIESTIFWKDDNVYNVRMKNFSFEQTDEILRYANAIENIMQMYLDFNYSIILNFAFTNKPYFTEGKFSSSNLLFYGLRTAYNKIDLGYNIL